MDHGPVLAGPDATDRGHQGILTNNYASMTINVTDCSFENDHDGIESANFTPEEAGVVATGQQPIQSCSGNPCAGMVSPSIKVR